MKNVKHLKITSLIAIFCLSALFYSCNPVAGGANSVTIDNVDVALCNSKDDQNHHGCSCSFMDVAGDANSIIFSSNMNRSKNACISINGATEVFTGKRLDHRVEHHRQSHMPNWIMVTEENKIAIFDHLVDMAEYDTHKDALVQALLAMHDLPDEIPAKIADSVPEETKNSIQKLCYEALDMAKKERENGNHGAPIEIELSNDNYDVYIKGAVENHNEDGSDNYVGTIDVKDKTGKVVGTKEFRGTCLCA
ncbi:MAG: hypothetical protein AAGA77_02605 [Bacteroidota bacterium]